MQVELITMAQEMNLEDSSMAHFIVLKLPGGVLVKALISAESANAVVFARVEGTAPPKEDAPREAQSPIPNMEMMPDEPNTLVFGSEPPPVPQPKPPVRKQRVEKDEYGYPILRGSPTSGPDLDEDGIGQL